jgi:energy-coupling factor transporter ATP-binding protein EcfA2
MKLQKLMLHNFQGIRDFTLDLEDGKNCSVSGDNATGKSTLFSAYMYLLFEKDSLGKKDFDLKTRVNGEPLRMVNHEVEGVFDIDGKTVTLKRVFSEKWTKKRGSAEQVFDGHVTDHYVDGVPRSKGEYQKFIDGISPEKTFMVLTSPTYFNEQVSWQERRSILMDLCPPISDEDVFRADPELEPLRTTLANRAIDDAKKVTQVTRTKINADLKEIPIQIAEINRMMSEAVNGNLEAMATKAQRIAKDLDPLREEKIRILSGGQVAAKQKELAEIDTAIITLRNKHAATVPDVSNERKQLHDIANRSQTLSLQVDSWKREAASLELQIEHCRDRHKTILAAWEREKARVFDPSKPCTECGQEYPENLKASQEADFNRCQSISLEVINKDGKENEIASKEAAASLEGKRNAIALNIQAIAELKAESVEVQAQIDAKCKAPEFTELPEFHELVAQQTAINAEIVALRGESGAIVAAVDEKITSKQCELDDVNRQITAIENAEEQRKRIEELSAREKDLARQYEEADRDLFLIERFIRAKVSMLEESINSHFELVNFRLFENQINGGLLETCTCTLNGVPYQSLNNAGRIQGGMDIARALGEKNKFTPPIFIDNAESVTSYPNMPGQVIKLVVSEQDKSLRVVS